MIEMKERSDKGITPSNDEVDQLFAALEHRNNITAWVMGPIIVFFAALVTSFVAVTLKPLIGVCGAVPYSAAMTVFGLKPHYDVLLLYLAVAAIGGSVPFLIGKRKSSNQAL